MAMDKPTSVGEHLATIDANIAHVAKRVDELVAWTKEHDKAHQKAAVKLEARVAKLEAAVGFRSWLGGIGVLLSAAFTFLTRHGGN